MACGPETDFDRMLSRGNKPELIEERCHPKNLSGSNSEKRGKVRYCLLGDKPKFGLDSLKNRNEVFSRGRKPFEERRDRFSNLFLFGFITAFSHVTLQYIILVRLDQRGWRESLSTASDALFMTGSHFFLLFAFFFDFCLSVYPSHDLHFLYSLTGLHLERGISYSSILQKIALTFLFSLSRLVFKTVPLTKEVEISLLNTLSGEQSSLPDAFPLGYAMKKQRAAIDGCIFYSCCN